MNHSFEPTNKYLAGEDVSNLFGSTKAKRQAKKADRTRKRAETKYTKSVKKDAKKQAGMVDMSKYSTAKDADEYLAEKDAADEKASAPAMQTKAAIPNTPASSPAATSTQAETPGSAAPPDAGGDDTPPPPKKGGDKKDDTIFGLPKPAVYVGGGILVLVGIGLAIKYFKGKAAPAAAAA